MSREKLKISQDFIKRYEIISGQFRYMVNLIGNIK